MIANDNFLIKDNTFWAYVRFIGQEFGYSKKGKIITPTKKEISTLLNNHNFSTNIIMSNNRFSPFGEQLLSYLNFRADVLNKYVHQQLMNAQEAKDLYEAISSKGSYSCPIPMNKQRGAKKAPAYLTAIVNMLIEEHSEGHLCNYDPHKLTMFSSKGHLVRTFARRLDGAFPTIMNPVAIWEIKEYYYTTTFGSRVAGGVYETLLDGLEIEEMSLAENIDCLHYLIVDSKYTWWECGKPYLCRLIDMLHMGLVDEIMFGKEVIDRLPFLVKKWCALAK